MNKENELISIIMSTFNTNEKYLIESINSILEQKYKNIELIIICDGNHYEYETIKKIKDNRIVAIENEKNMGLAYSLNKGIEMAKGKYVARMDADDICLNNRIKIQYKYMEKNKNIDVCSMMAISFGNARSIIYNQYKMPDEIEIQLLYLSPLIHPSVMYRGDFLKNNKILYNEEFKCAQDFELWNRIVTSNNIAIIKKIGLMYRVHNKQISKEKRDLQIKLRNQVIHKNIYKICNSYDEKVEKCLLMLGNSIATDRMNYKNFSDLIDYTLKINTNYNYKKVKKIFYNRYFHILLKNGLIIKEFKEIIKNKAIRKKIFRIFNVYYILCFLISAYKASIERKFLSEDKRNNSNV